MATVNLDTRDLLTGPSGVVSQSMAAFAPTAAESVRRVASERFAAPTGAYAASVEGTWDGRAVEVSAGVPYATIVERGSAPHEISSDGVLAFSVGGVSVFTKRVQHPGTRPLAVLMDGVRRAGRDVFGQ